MGDASERETSWNATKRELWLAYFQFYGPALFGAAAVIGGYLGWKARQPPSPA